ncbi:MAG: UDP-2,3-diacylglucosamine diphosphatase [Deltaproteobacteria bacterium]|nr:UDP-2,3-diacylglucosamine diphosphatase [Deltaproteobacteria bacterium]
MKAIFLADAHLRDPEAPSFRDLLVFFDHLPDDLERLFILGDFFDFWYGYQKTVFSVYEPVLEALEKLRDRDIKLTFFAGNHELALGPRLEKLGDCVADHQRITLDGRKIFLTHGDYLDPDDYGYHLWRALIRSRPVAGLIELLPPTLTWKIAARLSHRSRNSGSNKKIIPPAVYNRCAAILKNKQVETIICGHFHQPRRETFFLHRPPGKTVYFLGAWENERSWLLYSEGRFSFHNFHR